MSFERRFQPQSGFVKVTCNFNIRGEYFKARYFSIQLAYCFFTNQLTGFFMPLHNACVQLNISLQGRPAVSNLTILISYYVVGWLRWTLNHSVLLDLVSVYISTLVCLEDRKWCGLIGSLQKTNQVAVGSIRVFSKLGCVLVKVQIWKIGVLPCFFVEYKNILLQCLWCIIVPQNGEGLNVVYFRFNLKQGLRWKKIKLN